MCLGKKCSRGIHFECYTKSVLEKYKATISKVFFSICRMTTLTRKEPHSLISMNGS